jgi:GTP pyrophosphokinase
VAVLHDVVEDSEYDPGDIDTKFGSEISEAVEALTKPADADYITEYIPQVGENDLARKVKQADLRDNLDITRLSDVTQDNFKNIQKYHRSLQKLNDMAENNK